jgi:hypothetical protein
VRESEALIGDAVDIGAEDCQGEEGESRALRGKRQEPEEDWVLCGLIGGEIAFEAADRVGHGCGGNLI